MIGFYNVSVILTYLGVVSAVFGMSQAFQGNFKIAILCLMISGFTDMYDGTIAKKIKRSEDAKKFGIEIDSLCDLVCFGVYPVVIGYCLGMDSCCIDDKVDLICNVACGLSDVDQSAHVRKFICHIGCFHIRTGNFEPLFYKDLCKTAHADTADSHKMYIYWMIKINFIHDVSPS